jgi:hypothetical protein
MHLWQNQLSVSAGGTRIPTQTLKFYVSLVFHGLKERINERTIELPMVPVITLITAYHWSSIVLTAASWTYPYLIAELVLKHSKLILATIIL